MNDSLRRIAPALLAAALIFGGASSALALGNGTGVHLTQAKPGQLDLTDRNGVEMFMAQLNAEPSRVCGTAPISGGKTFEAIQAFSKANSSYQSCAREAKQNAALRMLVAHYSTEDMGITGSTRVYASRGH